MSEHAKALAMVPDSTQSGNGEKDGQRKKRKKKKQQQQAEGKQKEDSDGKREPVKRKKKKSTTKRKVVPVRDKSVDGVEKDGDMTSDLDLTKPLFTLGHYINDREEMLKQAFQSVSKEQLLAMIPDGLKDCPMDVLKAVCLRQLEGMSKKRIQHVLAGEEMLSSSDTDESGNELNDERMEEQPGEAGDGDKEAEIDKVPVEENTDVVREQEGDGLVQDEVEGQELMEFQEDFVEEIALDGNPYVKVEPLSDASPERSTGDQQSPAIHQDDEELEREYPIVRSPLMEPEGEGQTSGFREEQAAEQPVPVKRCKKRGKTAMKNNIDPADLEEGEVDDVSSEYTEGSEEDSDTDVNEMNNPGETGASVCQVEEASHILSSIEGDEISQAKMRQGICRTNNVVPKQGSEEVKLGTVEQCLESEKQESGKSEGGPEEDNVPITSDKQSVTLQVITNSDAISVNNESELEDEQEVAVEEATLHQSGEIQEPLSGREYIYDMDTNDLDSAKNSVEGEESEDSSSQDVQGDQSDLIKSNKDTTAEVAVKAENNADKNEVTEPMMDVLELELRARAIRSLMKHCVTEKK